MSNGRSIPENGCYLMSPTFMKTSERVRSLTRKVKVVGRIELAEGTFVQAVEMTDGPVVSGRQLWRRGDDALRMLTAWNFEICEDCHE